MTDEPTDTGKARRTFGEATRNVDTRVPFGRAWDEAHAVQAATGELRSENERLRGSAPDVTGADILADFHRARGRDLAESLARLRGSLTAFSEGFESASGRRPGDVGRLSFPVAWECAHAEAAIREEREGDFSRHRALLALVDDVLSTFPDLHPSESASETWQTVRSGQVTRSRLIGWIQTYRALSERAEGS